jgi:hypothetical protein
VSGAPRQLDRFHLRLRGCALYLYAVLNTVSGKQ